MKISKGEAIKSLYPEAKFIARGAGIDAEIDWHQPTTAPVTDEQIAAEMARLELLQPAKIADSKRQQAYINEADPLFFKAQRGEATMEEWQAKIAEIKARFPKEQA